MGAMHSWLHSIRRHPRTIPILHWFSESYDTFVYVDRIIVSAGLRGQGVTPGLFDDPFERARMTGYQRIGCELNAKPPNPQSDLFHDTMGFS